ncbi:MAG TPA: outer membrane protein assembly factor BamE, partial [Burkholderiales bacterium]|nr:outer membrane protein assembly factor BamE [Burkholderiales bacterium]
MQKLAVLIVLCLAGCSWSALSPYKVDIQQGNYVDQEMVSKLRPGMSKSQVRFALGSPLIADAFHQDRWDYVFRQQKGDNVVEQRVVTAVFDGDRLIRLEGNVFISPDFNNPQAAIQQMERDRQLTEPLGTRMPASPGAPPVALPSSAPGPSLGPPPAQPGPALAAPP